MRWLLIVPMLASCSGWSYLEGPVDNQEFVFVLNNGASFTRVLPIDWEPRYEGGFMRIDPRHRVMAIDVVLIHPIVPVDPYRLEQVRVVRNYASSKAQDHFLWVPPGQELHIGDPAFPDLLPVGPQTWIRPNEFRLEFRRPVGG